MVRRIRLFVVLVVVLGAVVALIHLPEILGERQILRIQGVHVEGARHLEPREVVEALDLPPSFSILDDPAPLEARLRGHPLVRDARVGRRLPRGLVAEVEEREPVALLPTPTLAPVDVDARVLPLEPARMDLDLPVLRTRGWDGAEAVDRGDLPPPQHLTSEIGRLGEVMPDLAGRVSEVTWGEGDALVARLEDPPITVHFPPGADSARLREGMAALGHAMARTDTIPRAVDLRFEDQVVVRYPTEEGR